MLNCDVNEIFRLVLRQHVSLVVNTSRSNFTEYVTILEKKKKKEEEEEEEGNEDAASTCCPVLHLTVQDDTVINDCQLIFDCGLWTHANMCNIYH